MEPIDILAKAVAHAKSERSSSGYVPPGGVQYVTLPVWVVEALHAQIASPVPPHAAGEEERTWLNAQLIKLHCLGWESGQLDGHNRRDAAALDLIRTILDEVTPRQSPAASQATPERDDPKWVTDIVREAHTAGGSVANWCGVVAYLDRSRQRLVNRVAELERERDEWIELAHVHKEHADAIRHALIDEEAKVLALQSSAAQEPDYRVLSGCMHARHESCESCTCSECGTRAVWLYSDDPNVKTRTPVVHPGIRKAIMEHTHAR